jgi:hypothetical protein
MPQSDPSTSLVFLAETSRCLAGSLDYETTLVTGAGLALPHFGTWCMVDVVEPDDSIRRVAVPSSSWPASSTTTTRRTATIRWVRRG